MKTCSKCKNLKPYSDFHKDKSRKDGCQRTCRPCVAAMDAERRKNNADHLNRLNKAWRENNKERRKEYLKKWEEENKEKIIAYRKEYYHKNRERLLAENKKYRDENKEKEAKRNDDWAKRNPELAAQKTRIRRARKLSAQGSHTASDIKEILERQGGKCVYCSVKLKTKGKDKYHVDHIEPISKGGSDCRENLQILCPSCNIRKGSKCPIEWANQIGMLF